LSSSWIAHVNEFPVATYNIKAGVPHIFYTMNIVYIGDPTTLADVNQTDIGGWGGG